MEKYSDELQSILKSRERKREEDFRGAYYRDTTAIIHSSPFRRLKHKTQVFFSPSNDHVCTRIEHVLHTASIAATISRALDLDTELSWAIGLGHDLGHAPFGHVGENIISSFSEKKGLGPFEHEINSLRVVDFLANGGEGLNLTYAVRDGIVCHNGEHLKKRLKPTMKAKKLSEVKERKGLVSTTYEGVIMRFSDAIAYLGRDWEDAKRIGILNGIDLPKDVKKTLGSTNGEIINTLVSDLVNGAGEDIGFSSEIFEAVEEFSEFNYKNIYKSETLEGYTKYFSRLLTLIVNYLDEIYEKYGLREEKYKGEGNLLSYRFFRHAKEVRDKYIEREGDDKRLIIDYISGMTDSFAIESANQILQPDNLIRDAEKSIFLSWLCH